MGDRLSSRPAALTFIVASVLTLTSAWPLFGHFASSLPSDLGDPVLNTWLLWWNAGAMPLSTTWWNAPMFFPAPGTMALSESLLGLTPLTTPLQWIGASPAAAYNVAFLLAGPLSAAGAAHLAWKLTRRRDAALIAGLAFGFSPYRIAQMPHLQMLWACWMPFGLAAAHDYLSTRRRASLVALGACWLLNALCNGYFLVFFAVLLVLWALWFVRERRDAIAISASLVLASLPLIPLLIGYRNRQAALGLSRGLNEVQTFSADLSALFSASPNVWLASHWSLKPGPEGELYPGLALALVAGWVGWGIFASWRAHRRNNATGATRAAPRPSRVRRGLIGAAAACAALAIAVAWSGGWAVHVGPISWTAHHPSRFVTVGFWCLVALGAGSVRFRAAWRNRSPLGFYALAALVMFVFALGPSAHAWGQTMLYKAPYSWLMELPGGDSLRAPARFGMLMLLCLGQVAAIAFARATPRPQRAILIALIVLILAEGWLPALPVATIPPSFSAPPALAHAAAIVEVPWNDDYQVDVRALINSMNSGRPSANGFSGYAPPHYAALQNGVRAGDVSVLSALSGAGSLAVFVDAGRDAGRVLFNQLRELTAGPPAEITGAGAWFLLPRNDAANDPWIDDAGAEITIASASATINASMLPSISDGDLRTRWDASLPQQPGDAVTLDFGRDVEVHRVEFSLAKWSGNYPRQLELRVSAVDGAVSQVIWVGSTASQTVRGALHDPRAVPVRIDITHPQRGRRLTLTNLGADPKVSWSIAELRVFGR